MGRILDEYKIVERYLERGIKRDGHCIIFEENRWDDYSFKTTFEVYHHKDQEHPKRIGSIRIANIDKAKEKEATKYYTTFEDIPKEFTELNSDYISLGNTEYYKNIYNIFKNNATSILKDLNDIAYCVDLYEKHKKEIVVKNSFLRKMGNESTVIEELKQLAKVGTRFSYNFKINYKQNSKVVLNLHFKSDDGDPLPTNMHAIIGKNGTGKTTFLTDLLRASLKKKAKIESRFSTDKKMIFSIIDNENLDLSAPVISSYFNKIIYVSFSIFDTMPEVNIHKDTDKDTDIELKLIGKNKNGQFDTENQEIEFKKYLKKLVYNRESFKLFDNTISKLNMFRPTLYEEYGNGIDEMSDEDKERYISEVIDLYVNESSSGQKIVLQTLAAFISEIEPKTLVIFDEPELHLHPPLLSNFIRSISKILIEKNGLGIIATHSPVVLQEIPKSNVYILNNEEKFISVRRPKNETFGENISTLMDTVFELDIKESGFYNLIKQLVESKEYTEEDIRNIPLGRDGDLYKRLLLSKQDDYYSERNDG